MLDVHDSKLQVGMSDPIRYPGLYLDVCLLQGGAAGGEPPGGVQRQAQALEPGVSEGERWNLSVQSCQEVRQK